ncbi:hypothetical protein CARUB_v10012091mg, partial [Capsella rubella]
NHLQLITEAAYPGNKISQTTFEYLTERAILTPRNEYVDDINAYMLSKVKGESKEYFSSDSIGKADTDGADYEALYPPKKGVPIMLLRNINPKEGMCNGTRMIVTNLGERVIEAEIVTGTHVGKKVFIPRIILSQTQTDHPFTLRRRQFPVRVCYTMTINKSQG